MADCLLKYAEHKNPKRSVWAFQTKKLKQVTSIGPFPLALESTAESAASGIFCSRAVTVGAPPLTSSDSLSPQWQWCYGENLPLQGSFDSLSTHSVYSELTGLCCDMSTSPPKNMCIVTFFFYLYCCSIHSAVSAASIRCVCYDSVGQIEKTALIPFPAVVQIGCFWNIMGLVYVSYHLMYWNYYQK